MKNLPASRKALEECDRRKTYPCENRPPKYRFNAEPDRLFRNWRRNTVVHNEKPPALHSGGFSSPDKSAIDSMTIVENRPMYVFRKDADHSGKHFNIIACRVQRCASARPQRMACALRFA
ncbi:hypothetical protein ALO40_102377 [Pseudomonas syringae pv. viburni]|uniref:Uncharacterized protein n=1 Tax=Pseudomonas syringae pv. viburni TaxID=251703 RepID=A0A0Q0CZ28_9PSED|nr:hypothetical protein ALO40_102377 [Pseudomonas syringae pv. viburni]